MLPKEAFTHADFVGADRRGFCRDGKIRKCKPYERIRVGD